VHIAGATAGAHSDQALRSYDDNELSRWSNDGSLDTAWIRYTFDREATVSEIVMKLHNFRRISYNICIYVDGKKVWQGDTHRSLGYVTLPVKPTRGRSLSVSLQGIALDQDAFHIVEISGQRDQADSEKTRNQGVLSIVEIEIYEKPLGGKELPAPEQILTNMTLANTYFMNKWPDPGADIVTDRTRPSNLWTRSTYYEGLMALYRIDPQPRYLDYMVQWGESHNWAPTYNNLNTRDANHHCCGQTYIDLYWLDKQPQRVEPMKQCIDKIVNSPKRDDWWWIDALHMAMPVFARLGIVYEDPNYFQALYELYTYTKTRHGTHGLYNTEDHLWWRDRDFEPPYTSPNGEDCYWSRGNGWVLAGLARTLDMLPEEAVGRDDYLTTYKEMCAALIKVQRSDGFWNVSLYDPNEYGGPELSGTALFTYGMAWGIRQKILDEKTYLPVVVKAWNGIVTQSLHDNGFLGYVQGTGKEPSSNQPVGYDIVPNFEDFGLGAFLLAGSEVYKLSRTTKSI
jgi:rhamnogalacturonyl hydrolase YesR